MTPLLANAAVVLDINREVFWLIGAIGTLNAIAFVPAIRGYKKAVQAEVWREIAEKRLNVLETRAEDLREHIATIERILVRIEERVTGGKP